MKEIAILHHTVPPAIGGIESTIYHHLRLMSAAGYQLRLIASRGEEGYYEASFFHSVDFRTIPELDPNHPAVQEALAALPSNPEPFHQQRDRLAETLYALLESQELCMVHNAVTTSGHLPLTAALFKISQEKKIRFAAWCHDFYPPEAEAPAEYPYYLPYIAWQGVEYVVIDRTYRENLAARLHIPVEQIRVIPPGVDPQVFMKWERSTERLVDQLDLLSANPLMLIPELPLPKPGLELALEVLAELVRRGEAAAVIVAGHRPSTIESQEYIESIKKRRAALGMQNRFHFAYEHHGPNGSSPISEAVLLDLYNIASLLFIPSELQGSGHPIFHAGLARLPMFAAESPVIREISGELVDTFDPAKTAAEITEILLASLRENRAYRLRRRVLKRFTWDVIFKERILPLIQGS